MKLVTDSECASRENWRMRPAKRFLRMLLCSAATLIAGCSLTPQDISGTLPYSSAVGAVYRVIGEVDAYGIAQVGSSSALEMVVVIPRTNSIGGPEILFEYPVERGKELRVTSVRRQTVWGESGVFFLVEMKDARWPETVPVRIELMRGNESHDPAGLNPQLYERVR